ncbi:anti-phage dCTP deaminase [Bradyrhizobium sp. HKCCYLS20291]|uniref:anti-phage dCTP deaminase n=1 Tax=Bradyrhizobium sp. HKCCYLS20291 TaxID=3420766 RepID=UPI003EB84DBD
MLPALPDPELFFGFCSPIGVENKKAYEILSNALRKYQYSTEYFKVTSLMKSLRPSGFSVTESPLEDRYDTYIKYANKIRDTLEMPHALAALCCTAVRSLRRQETGEADTYLPKRAYVFDQFKRKEEIDLLRQVYGRLFIVVSLYSEKKNRLDLLASRIAQDHSDARLADTHSSIAGALIKRDQSEENEPNGQRLEQAFPSADLFLNIDDLDGAARLLTRFLDALFGSNSVSPTHDEYGMYLARNAALRSVDLSRQVGAAIFSQEGEVVTLGCNEVPKALGGTYWPGDTPDARDFQKNYDSNERIKKSLLVDFTKRLKEAGFLKEQEKELDVARFILKETARGGALRDAQLMDLLEFGRMIHAEMSAICDAARLGKSVRQSTLYCTTFPCHLCAKHIVAAGIKRVVYIEPFPKSYAEQLHGDAIVVGRSDDVKKVVFEPFIGISPYRYRDLFARDRRKTDEGEFRPWIDNDPRPTIRLTVATYVENEAAVIKMLNDKVRTKVEKKVIEIVPAEQEPPI